MPRRSAKQKTAGSDHLITMAYETYPCWVGKGPKSKVKKMTYSIRRSHAWHVARVVWTWPNAVDIASYLIGKPLTSGQPVRGLKHVSSLGLVRWEMLREVLRKINRVCLKHRCLFLQKRRLVKRLSCTNKHRCLRKTWFISLSTSSKHLAVYKALKCQIA